MKLTILLFFASVISAGVSAQINKGNFLVGGNISYTSEKVGMASGDKFKQFGLNANVGYFVIKKLALGIRGGYVATSFKIESQDYHSRSSTISVAPFMRLYFLPAKNKVNVFTDASYISGRERSQQVQRPGPVNSISFNGYDLNAGPVFFINKHVALELALGIRNRSHRDEPVFTSSLGLQVHL
jgi:hypothetical protein